MLFNGTTTLTHQQFRRVHRNCDTQYDICSDKDTITAVMGDVLHWLDRNKCEYNLGTGYPDWESSGEAALRGVHKHKYSL